MNRRTPEPLVARGAWLTSSCPHSLRVPGIAHFPMFTGGGDVEWEFETPKEGEPTSRRESSTNTVRPYPNTDGIVFFVESCSFSSPLSGRVSIAVAPAASRS